MKDYDYDVKLINVLATIELIKLELKDLEDLVKKLKDHK